MTLEACLPQWAVVPTRLPSLRRPPIGFAHRGARAHAPENTLEAFALAVRLGATGLESDVWLTRDGEAVLDHDGVVRQRPPQAPDRRPATGPTCPTHIPTARGALRRRWAPTSSSRLDVKDPAAFDRTVEVARAAGDGALGAPVALPPRLGAGRRRGGRRAPRCAWSTRPSSGTCRRARSSGPPRWPDAGIDAVNLHHTEWTGGLTTLFHRFEVLCFGWDAQHDRILDDLLDAGIDAVYSDHVDRMVDALARRDVTLRSRQAERPAMTPDGRSQRPEEGRRRHSPPMSPGGQTRTKARPTMLSIGIGPRYG